MCRIASPFLLQRLKGSMSGDARDFNNIETRAVIKFYFSCNPEETGLPGLQVPWSLILFSGSGLVGLSPVPRTEKKNNWKVTIFRPTRRSLLPRRPGWTDNLLNFFFRVACKIYSNGLRSVLSFVGSMLNKSRVWSL